MPSLVSPPASGTRQLAGFRSGVTQAAVTTPLSALELLFSTWQTAKHCDWGGGAFQQYHGFQNAASGAFALLSNTTGSDNTANGFSTLYSNTTGFTNTAIGFESLYSNTTGTQNTAIGRSALGFNTTGSDNNALALVPSIITPLENPTLPSVP
jgi:hypothetical protein